MKETGSPVTPGPETDAGSGPEKDDARPAGTVLRRSLPKTPLLLIASYVLCVCAWAVSSPPGTAPDEYAHYLRALGAGRGDLILTKRPPPLKGPSSADKALRWQQKQARMVSIPARLSPEVFNCRAMPGQVENCTIKAPTGKGNAVFRSWVATYPPFGYMLPGLGMRLGNTPVETLIIGRLVSALTCLALIAGAVYLLWDPKRQQISLLGLVVATTPMVVFVASSLSASGPETSAGICFFACLIRLLRDAPGENDDRCGSPPSVWLIGAASGVVLALSRDLGAGWIAVDGLTFLALAGPKKVRVILKSSKWAAIVTGGIVFVALVASALWQKIIQPHPPLGLSTLKETFETTWGFFREIARQQIGVFGPLDTVMPGPAYFVWGLMLIVLCVLALLVGNRRERLVLAGLAAVNLFLASALDATQRGVGFGAQGRHLLPLAVTIPILAGEIVSLKQGRLGEARPRRLMLWTLTAAAAVYLIAWFTLAHRYSGGGWFSFLNRPVVWSPPITWAVGTALVATCGLLLVTAGFLSRPEAEALPEPPAVAAG
ncbi:MAG: DUF2142 domain-containing protein [Actinomycetota bacterium]